MPEIRFDPEYYHRCFARLPTTSEFVYTSGFYSSDKFNAAGDLISTQWIMSVIDKNGKSINIDPTKIAVEFPLLGPQYMFDGKRASFFARVPVRKKEKGSSFDNTIMVDPINKLFPHINWDAFVRPKKWAREDEEEKVNLLLRPKIKRGNDRISRWLTVLNHKIKKVPWQYAKNMLLERDVISVPLSDDWAATLSITPDHNFMLIRRMTPVAFVNKDNTAAMINRIYIQELVDLIPEIRIK